MARQVESRLVNEYLFEAFRNQPQWRRVRLGPVPTQDMAKAFKVTLRWADAIVKDGNIIVIIEGKMFPEFGGLGQLEAYADLMSRTPEFSEFKGFPIRMIYLTTKLDEDVKQQADSKGIEYVVFKPDWVKEYELERFRAKSLK